MPINEKIYHAITAIQSELIVNWLSLTSKGVPYVKGSGQ